MSIQIILTSLILLISLIVFSILMLSKTSRNIVLSTIFIFTTTAFFLCPMFREILIYIYAFLGAYITTEATLETIIFAFKKLKKGE